MKQWTLFEGQRVWLWDLPQDHPEYMPRSGTPTPAKDDQSEVFPETRHAEQSWPIEED